MAVRDDLRREAGTRRANRTTARQALREYKSRNKRTRFIRIKMWVNYLVSVFQKDRGKIPSNIGNKILITNNLYITKSYMSSVVQITSLSLETPQYLCSELVRELRDKDSSAVIDLTFKNTNFDVQLKDSGLMSRIDLWERAMDNDMITDREKETAARCLYTVHVAESGKRLMKSRIFLTIRHTTGSELMRAEKIVYDYLTSIGCVYLPVITNMKNTMKYISIMSDHKDKTIKDVKSVVNSERTLSQMLPNTGSRNDSKGIYMGMNLVNNTEFLLDLDQITSARCIYAIGISGSGKTALILNMVCSAREQGWAVCVQDIKGNEFTYVVQCTGGYIVSCRENSTGYVNSFAMYKEDATDTEAERYFRNRIAFSKKQLMILSGITKEEEIIELEEILDLFLDSVYVSMGVLESNRSTWKNTLSLNPYTIYDMLNEYMTPEMQAKHKVVATKMLLAFRMYMTPNGSKSYIFKEEFDYAKILKSNSLGFDFGILDESSSNIDPVLFRLKFSYMQKLNSEFVAYKYSQDIKVLKILEESQIAIRDPKVLEGYVEEFTLRRAQGQTTIMLGNAIAPLVNNPASEPLIENVTALLIGKLNVTAQEDVIRTFGLQKEEEMIKSVGIKDKTNAFVFINRMQQNAQTPIIKVQLDRNVKYKLLTPVKTKPKAAM